jgi:hypothetical protein
VQRTQISAIRKQKAHDEPSELPADISARGKYEYLAKGKRAEKTNNIAQQVAKIGRHTESQSAEDNRKTQYGIYATHKGKTPELPDESICRR